MAVEPVTSEKTMVMIFRTSGASSGAASGEPQPAQKRASSAFCLPQLVQNGIVEIVGSAVGDA